MAPLRRPVEWRPFVMRSPCRCIYVSTLCEQHSSKGLASTVLARLIGTTQPTAWKIGHTLRKMMDSSCSDALLLKGIVELDETYVGGKPARVPGVRHKRGKGTSKQ